MAFDIETIEQNAARLRQKRIGVVLCGSFANVPFGAYALYTVLARFRELGIRVKSFFANSAQCFTAAAAACGFAEICELKDRIMQLTPQHIYEMRRLSFLLDIFRLQRPSILEDTPLRAFIHGNVDVQKLFDASRTDFAELEIMTTDLNSGKLVCCTNYIPTEPETDTLFLCDPEHFADIEMASKALIPYFAPQHISDMRLADGGYRANCPVNRAAKRKCDLVLIFDIFGLHIHPQPKERGIGWPHDLYRAMSISVTATSEKSVKLVDRVSREIDVVNRWGEILAALQGTEEAAKCKAFFHNALGLDMKIPMQCHVVAAEMPVHHVDFNRFDQHTLRMLAEIGYWAGKKELGQLGIDDGADS